MTASNSILREIEASTLKQWLDQQTVLLIDVREPAEYAEEHLAEAKPFPLSQFDPTQIVPEPGQMIVLYCRSGNRSAQAAQRLVDAGLTNINHLKGGLPAWKAVGYPTQRRHAPISLFRQIQIVAGSLVVIGTVFGALVSPWFLLLSGFVGAGLVFAGITNTCALGRLLARLPYNQQ